MKAEQIDQFRHVPLSELFESKQNTRQHVDPKKQLDLEENIKTHGILTPLLVRPNGKGFEIGAGSRRYRAAKAVGLTEAPCWVRSMSDAVFLELITIENLQREDIHPLDEAEGYEILMTKTKYDVDRIAERIGKSSKYVYDRVKLLQLTKESKALFRSDKITAGHAILLARLSPTEQKAAIDPDRGGLFEGMRNLPYDERDEENEDPYADLKAVSVRELQAWIDENVRFNTKAVDARLFPETAHELKAAQELEGKVVPITRDHFVQPHAKEDGTRTYGPQSWKRADGREESKECEHGVTGCIVVGPGRGDAFKVCTDKKHCRVHWGEEMRAAAKRAKEATSNAGNASKQKKAEEREQAEEARKELARARWEKSVPALLKIVAERINKAPTKSTGLLGDIVSRYVSVHHLRGLGKLAELVPRGKSADDLVRHLAFAIVSSEAQGYWAHEQFPKRLKAFGIDAQKIIDEVAPIEKPKTAAAEKKNGKRKKAA